MRGQQICTTALPTLSGSWATPKALLRCGFASIQSFNDRIDLRVLQLCKPDDLCTNHQLDELTSRPLQHKPCSKCYLNRRFCQGFFVSLAPQQLNAF